MCPARGGETKRNGRTRWRCKSCGAFTAQRYDDDAKLLKLSVRRLLSKRPQSELSMPARTFWHLAERPKL